MCKVYPTDLEYEISIIGHYVLQGNVGHVVITNSCTNVS